MLTGLVFFWLITAVAGYGLAFGRIWRRCTGSAEPLASFGDIGLVGLLSLAAIGIIFHFFIPLSPGFALILNLVGLILLVVLGRSILLQYDLTNWLFILLCAMTFGLQAQLDALSPDAGIYYIPSI